MMTGTIPQDLKSPSSVEDSSGSDENSSISAPRSRFDEVLDHVKSFEESSSPSEEADQSVTPPEEPSEEDLPPSEILPEEDPELNLSEKERVLRKVLGEKYQQGDVE